MTSPAPTTEASAEAPIELDADLGERYYRDDPDQERTYTERIVASIAKTIEGHFRAGRGPARRDAHAFDNGCVRAIFRVNRDLAPHLQHGVFVPGQEYRAWIRFSNGNSEPRSRWWFDARGMAIKLTGVPGQKLMDDEKHTQDFVLISSPRFFVDDLERYQATLEAFLRGGVWDQNVSALLQLNWRERLIALKVNLLWISNPLLQRYWSMVPYRLGAEPGRRTAVKYQVRPRLMKRRSAFRRFMTFISWNFSLKKEMNDTLSGHEVWFDFYVQRRVDSERTPIEDSTVEWTEDVSKPEHVAKIIIPMQNIMSMEQAQFCENLSFSPWHALPAHKPLGLVNRVRREAYRRISALRHDLNRAPRTEPTGDETFGRR